MNKIKLTIGIPTRNRSDFLPMIINSVIGQIKQNNLEESIEIIVANNASTDSTNQILQRYSDTLKIFKFISHENDVGIDANVKSIIEVSRGKYIWFLGDDDDLYEGALKEVYSVLNDRDNIGGVLLGYDVYDKKLEKKLKSVLPKADGEIDFKEFIQNDFFLNSFLSITLIKNPKIRCENYLKQDIWIGSLYYHSALQLMMAYDGIYIIKKPLIKFRSGVSTLGVKVNAATMPSKIAEWFAPKFNVISRVRIHEASCRNNLLPFVLSRKLTGNINIYESIELLKQDCLSVAAWLYLLPMLLVPAKLYKLSNGFRKKIKIVLNIIK